MASTRQVFHAKIGQYLAELRDARGWSQGQAVIKAKDRIKLGTLKSLEAGRIKHPDESDLRTIANLYGVDYPELVERYVAENYGSDLSRHDGDQRSDLSKEGSANVPAAARLELQRLTDLVARYEAEAREVRTATDAIVKVALRLEQIRKTSTAKPSRGRGDRKVG